MSMSVPDTCLHPQPVGASTFKYGVTIPVEAQTERMRAIDRGCKAPVTIMFGNEEPVIAEIRRSNNKPGHRQCGYENKVQDRLRLYLLRIFGHSCIYGTFSRIVKGKHYFPLQGEFRGRQ
jgi:hypothetical protein